MNRASRAATLATVTLLLTVGLVPLFVASAASPSRVLLGFSGDPATTRAVTWRTETPSAHAAVQVAVDRPGSNLAEGARSVTAETRRVTVAPGQEVSQHAARIEGLEPGTRYAYRVGDGAAWSPWHTFTTASTTPEPFRFIYIGDAQNGLNDTWPRVMRAAASAAPDARFVVHAGDIVAEGPDDTLWGQWVSGLGPLATEVPHLPVPGNHDEHRPKGTPDSSKVHGVSPLWNAHFALPANGPAGLDDLPGQNYYLDYQGVRFIAIDANPFANEDYVESERERVKSAELAWIEKALSSNPNRWTIVVQHQPLFPVSKERDFPEMRASLGALYDRYHVDLVLQGHDHAYARTFKVAGEKQVGPNEAGTVYTIAVSGSKMYTVTKPRPEIMALVKENLQTFQVIGVEPGVLTYESHTADGKLLDRFELRKTGKGTELR